MPSTTVSASTDADFLSAVEQAKLAALYNFAYGLSHEINNPLANIATRAQTLLADEKDPERRRKLATIVQQAFKAHEMIADLMLFAHPPQMQPRETDLVQLVNTVLSELKQQAREQNTRLELVGESEPLLGTVDPTAMAVAVKAIVQNALEAIQTDGVVRVTVERRDNELGRFALHTDDSDGRTESSPATESPTGPGVTSIIHPAAQSAVPRPLFPPLTTPHSALRASHSAYVLTITDTGPGIPPDVRPNIFDPFFSGREAGRGLGLGLSKAWRIVDLHGGRIEVESEPGSGATFRVILPAQS